MSVLSIYPQKYWKQIVLTNVLHHNHYIYTYPLLVDSAVFPARQGRLADGDEVSYSLQTELKVLMVWP